MAEPENRSESTPGEAVSAPRTLGQPRPESALLEGQGRVVPESAKTLPEGAENREAPQSRAIMLGTPEEEARRRSVKEAQAFLDRTLSRRWKGRMQALEAVAVHPAPMRRARQIVDFEQRKRVFGEPASGIHAPEQPKIRYTKRRKQQLAAEGKDVAELDRLTVAYCWPRDHVDPRPERADLSDVQELLVKLTNMGAYDPIYRNALNRLAHDVVAKMPLDEFESRAASLLRSAS